MQLSLRAKLVSVFGATFAVMVVAAAIVVFFAISANGEVTKVDTTLLPATSAAGDLHLAAAEYQKDQIDYVTGSSAAAIADAKASIDQHLGEVNDAFDTLNSLSLAPATEDSLAAARSAWKTYVDSTAVVLTGDTISVQQSLQSGQISKNYDAVDTALDDLTSALDNETSASTGHVGSLMGQLPVTISIGCILAVLLGMALAFYLARRLAGGIRDVEAALDSIVTESVSNLASGLEAMADNDLTVKLSGASRRIENKSRDEVGRMAETANTVLAEIDRTVENYERARASLAGALAQVHEAAASVTQTSAELTQAAQESGNGSTQIARTISQVAAGASDQAHAASETSHAVGDLRTVIEQVRSGAAQTAESVGSQAEAVTRMTKSIRSASRASTDVHSLGSAASEAAANGATTVRQTVEGMTRIKDAVEGAAVKVTELGAKGDQIGAIVETIDDIAEQTNLLALNAAIEAARAGEMGKGFAVVADEVRKLAERASQATKEIGGLIEQVQKGTEEAVKAMQLGATEVEQGTILADRAGQSLDEIADSVAATKTAADSITAAVNALTGASQLVMEGIEETGVVARDNANVGAAIGRSVDETSSAVASIAAIAEENSAAAEEVSAATEEMSAQAQELVASADSLSRMAAQLDALVARFRFETVPGPVVMSTAAKDRPRVARAA